MWLIDWIRSKCLVRNIHSNIRHLSLIVVEQIIFLSVISIYTSGQTIDRQFELMIRCSIIEKIHFSKIPIDWVME